MSIQKKSRRSRYLVQKRQKLVQFKQVLKYLTYAENIYVNILKILTDIVCNTSYSQSILPIFFKNISFKCWTLIQECNVDYNLDVADNHSISLQNEPCYDFLHSVFFAKGCLQNRQFRQNDHKAVVVAISCHNSTVTCKLMLASSCNVKGYLSFHKRHYA